MVKEWKAITIGSIGKTYNGLTGKTAVDFTNGNNPYITFLNVLKNPIIDIEAFQYVNIRKNELQWKVKKQDIIFNTSSETPEEIGMSSTILEDVDNLYINSFCFGFRLNNVAEYDSLYLSYYFRSRLGRNLMLNLAQGSTRYNLSKTNFMKLSFSCPEFKEQKEIARVLYDIYDLIHSLLILIEKKENIKQGTMQILLTGKKRLFGYDDDMIDKKIIDFGEVVTGSTPSTFIKKYWNGKIPWVTPTDIGSNRNINNSLREISELGLNKVRQLPKNTLLVTCIASIGKNAILRKSGACNQQINAIIPNKDNDVDYLYYLINNNKNYLLSKAGITATNMVSKKVFEQIEFYVAPTLKEQKEISLILSEMDEEIESLKAILEKYESIKEGMLMELLTGRIRLV